MTFVEKCDRLFLVSERKIEMKKMTNKIKWLMDDLGAFELNAWLWVIGGAALTAAVLVLLTGEGPEVYRYWRVFFLKLF